MTTLPASDLTLSDVLAAIGYTVTRPPTGQHNTVTDPAGRSLTAHAGDVWAWLVRRGLISLDLPHCAACGYVTIHRAACECWRIDELEA